MKLSTTYAPSPTGLKFHKNREFIRGVIGVPGCLDKDSEVLTPQGWLKIADWAGEEILCFDKDKNKGFFSEVEYVKHKMVDGETFNYFKSRSVDMQLSDEHTMLFSKKFNPEVWRTEKAHVVAQQHSTLRDGWDGRVPVSFSGEVDTGTSLSLTNNEIRFLVALSADGSLPHRGTQVVFCFHKERKVKRLRELVSILGFSIKESVKFRTDKGAWEHRLVVSPPEILRKKGLHYLRGVSQDQANIVLDELVHWDGWVANGKRDSGKTKFFSTSKFEEAEFVCELAVITGHRAYRQHRIGRGNRKDSWQIGLVKTDVATLHQPNKLEVEQVPSVDGYKYCFTTPTGFFLARRNGRTFITGNSGKSVMCIQELLWIGLNQAPDAAGVRNARFAIIRATYSRLELTTIKTYSQWVPPLVAPVKKTAPMTSTLRVGLPDGTSANFEFVFIAVESEEDAEKLKSLELTAAFINEASEVDKSVLEMLETRMGRYPSPAEGGCSYSGIIFDSNPPGDSHWIAELDRQIQRGEKTGAVIFHQPAPFIPIYDANGEMIELKDNPEGENLEYLNQKPAPEGKTWTLEERRAFGYEYYRRQLSGKSQHWIDVMILGKYGSSFNGKPVYQAHWTESAVCGYPIKVELGHPVMLGIDTTGLNPAVVFGQMRLGTLHITHELMALDMPFIPFVKDFLRPFLAEHYPDCQVIAFTDPANPRDSNRGETPVQVLREHGITAQNAPTNKFKPRLDSVISFLQRREGLLIDARCEKIIDGFRGGYHYRPQRVVGVGQAYSSEPVKNEYSHIHDAVQYLCNGILHGSESSRTRPIKKPRSKRVY